MCYIKINNTKYIKINNWVGNNEADQKEIDKIINKLRENVFNNDTEFGKIYENYFIEIPKKFGGFAQNTFFSAIK